MNAKSLLLVLAAAGAMPGATATLVAAGYSKAEFTRLHNQVNVLKGEETPKPAAVGQEITNVTSVATGADSRAELRFPDKSLTRIGANSRFTLKGDGRTLDLDAGVMMLQVPKKIGGAKVRTAAVTAAVTGTTVLFEYLPGGFVKLICVEGSVDLSLNKNPSQFITLGAGQMIIMKSDGTSLPQPVDVDLETLLKSSKLISADDLGPNSSQIQQAMQQQKEEIKDGDLVVTNMIIEGRGTLVSLNNDTRTNVFNNVTIKDNNPPPSNPSNPGNNNPPPNNNPNTPPFTGTAPLIPGKTILNRTATIETNPHVEAYNTAANGVVRSEGIVYNGLNDGLFQYFTFGSTDVGSPTLQPLLNDPKDKWGNSKDGNWALYKFEDLFINGTPTFFLGQKPLDEGESSFSSFSAPESEGPPPIRDVIFSSQNGIRIGAASLYPEEEIPAEAGGQIYPWGWGTTTFDLRYSGLDNLVLYAQAGDIIVKSAYGHYAIRGYNQNVSLVAAGVQNDVVLQANIDLDSGGGYYWFQPKTANLNVIAGRDVKATWSKLSADSINVEAGQNVEINASHLEAKKRKLNVVAKKTINITNSSTLKALSHFAPDGVVKLEALENDINVTNSYLQGKTIELQTNGPTGTINLTGVTTSGDVFKATTLGTDGFINIGKSNINATYLIQLYAEGANGGVRFVDNTTLNSWNVKIAGKTVEILPGKNVQVPKGFLKVFTDNAQFNGVNGSGNFKKGPNVLVPQNVDTSFGARHGGGGPPP